LTVNRLRDPVGMPPHPTVTCHDGQVVMVLVVTTFFVYYESRKREVKIRLMNEGRCDVRLKARVEEST
jgi:hypothetical protein